MTPLIDADVLLYEIGFCGEYVDDDGNPQVREFDFVAELLDQKIKEICAEVWATEEPVLYLTGSKVLNHMTNKQRKREGKEPKEFNPNFREKIAKKKEYKGNRKKEKPFHFNNLIAYMLANYNVVVAEGMEADDLLSIHQYERLEQLNTIICSRDKDLRITPGMHYGWECGKQRSFGPCKVEPLGELELKGGNKIVGTGLKFFYSQLITGDTVDNIPGLPRGGPALAFKLLGDKETEEDCFNAVREAYEGKFGESWEEELMEQAHLLWMVRELDEYGKPVMWKVPDEC